MFDLNDKRSKRRKTIMGYAQMDAQHGVLLAAMDFEWTCRRAILALSKTSTPTLYESFIEKYSSFKGLEKAWQKEVIPFIIVLARDNWGKTHASSCSSAAA